MVVAGLTVLLAGLACVPGAGTVCVAGVPCGWLVLTAVVQPLWFVVAVRHVRAAEQAERDLVRAARGRRRRDGRGTG
ncbi:hypothetical protein AB0K60_09970 [Thermopolyspora sp. NPDC052614]|uniref:hypothetical protein n=1 Tax=Thermopolyspora sp. NPDC052614 TaxID=3155682 RepID=UPI0034470483